MPAQVEGTIEDRSIRLGGAGEAFADSIELAGLELDQELYFQNTEAALEYLVERVDRSEFVGLGCRSPR